MRILTELEGVCLGIINKQQPCTAYRVRCRLKEAPSSHWRASAGSVYPMLERLQQEEFLTSERDVDDGRGRQLLSVTQTGRKALKVWLLAGNERDLIASVTDPIRSRSFFLDLLPAQRRKKFIDELIVKMEDYLAETEQHLALKSASSDRDEYLGSLGAVKITEARLEWLELVREHLTEPE